MLRKLIISVLCAIFVFIPAIPVHAVIFDGADKINVVLDPGHGGKDSGAIGTYQEKYYNLKVAQYCADKLRENGSFNVFMTRSSDSEYLTLAERGLYGDSVNADILVSIHFNSGSGEKASGVEVYSSVLPRFDLSSLAADVEARLSVATGLRKKRMLPSGG